MKIIIRNLAVIFIVFYLSSVIAIYGQTNLKSIPYNIDIKENIKNVSTINLSTIGKKLTYIPLETTPECLIQQIKKILFSDSYIFVSEFNKFLQFDKNGKFIRQIGSKGAGPGEYISVGDFCIDEQKKEIYIIFISAPQILVFGFDGTFKNSFKLSFRPSQIIPKDQNSLMAHIANEPGKSEPSWVITNRHGIISASINSRLKRISQPALIMPYTPLYTFDNTLHFMEFGVDTLYYFRDALKKPYAIFSLGDLRMDPDPIITVALIKDEKLLNKFSIGSILENNDFLFITLLRGISNATIGAVYNKKTGYITILKDNAFKNDLGGGIGFWPDQIVNDNILVDYVDAFDLIKKIIPSDLRSRISETSNPVLMILK